MVRTSTCSTTSSRRARRAELRGERAQVVDRRAEERVAEVEEPGPERGAVGRRIEARGRCEALERPHEHRELEVDGGNAIRAGPDARAVEEGWLVEGTRRSTLEKLTSWTLWADKVVTF